MADQPKALRLANRLESDFIRSQTMLDAAAELRRLAGVEAEREALLEVVQKFVTWSEAERNPNSSTFWQRVEMCREVDELARAAIDAAKGGGNG